MSKRGLPTGVKMRHDAHYVEELTRTNRSVGRTIPIEKLLPNPDQPRREIGDLTELAGSIEQKGVLEPILVKPLKDGTFLIIAGERRWRAATKAGLSEVPCIEMDLDDQSIAEIALIENLQRKDLNIWEVADGLAHLTEKFGYTHEDIAKKIGKSRTTVTESLTIAGLPVSIREKCLAAEINAKSVLLEVARQFDEAAMHDFVETISDKGLNRKQVRKKARPVQSKASATSARPADPENRFSFSSDTNGNFELNIVFKDLDNFDKSDVLLALKETFDQIKAESGEN